MWLVLKIVAVVPVGIDSDRVVKILAAARLDLSLDLGTQQKKDDKNLPGETHKGALAFAGRSWVELYK
jgi:hypothetical protein